MKINAEEASGEALYKLLAGVVVPRPIAWVTTISENNVVNLAPFSCFTFLSHNPPLLGFTCGPRRGAPKGTPSALKDTARNIGSTPEFVVHIADDSMLEALHISADEFLPDESEAEFLKLPVTPSDLVRVPRLAGAPIAMECVLEQKVQFGRSGSEFIVGEIKFFHFRDGLCVNGKIDSEQLRPIGRLGGPVYSKLGEVVRMKPNRSLNPGGELGL
jgi:flavin reductase (DIM6/NTAB) family NADH-FMN oxidoreductase RutF